jgi:parvulin-like peptidyl-prolyl isomerase
MVLLLGQNRTGIQNLENHLESLKYAKKGEDFAAVAKSKLGSEDPSVVNNGGDLGYFTAFQMVYPFEEKAYTTPVGSVSEPFRTRFGYHILKVTDKRAARGTIKVAHLMISTGREASTETRQNAEKKINEIYDSLSTGASWEKISDASFHIVKKHPSKRGAYLAGAGGRISFVELK